MTKIILKKIILLSLIIIPSSLHSEIIRYAVFPAPPYMIDADKENSVLSGIDIEIVNEIAKRAGLEVEYIPCPWIRALELMKSGKADILTSVYKKPEREEFLLYFEKPFLNELPIAFYYRKDSDILIKKYSDLYKYADIAVLRGASYFPRFDKDTKLKKYEVSTQDQIFPMLVHRRIMVMAGYMPTENYYITVNNYSDIIAKSSYIHNEKAKVYMTIGKNSKLAYRFKQLDKINSDLAKEGFTARIVKKYYHMYRLEK